MFHKVPGPLLLPVDSDITGSSGTRIALTCDTFFDLRCECIMCSCSCDCLIVVVVVVRTRRQRTKSNVADHYLQNDMKSFQMKSTTN